ncbi:Arginine/serine-rich splicing factor scl25a transcript I [Gamsiella multidivaricata]|nr:Arginine/serine-rich splicing factor scl25a transcript I [Gamsiella multidivaricata]
MPRDRNDNTVSLHVSGFKENTRPSDLASLFEAFGRIADDYYTGQSRGFAYVQYQDEDDARRVHETREEFVLDGRKLEVQFAQGRRKTPNQMRGQGRGTRRSRSPDRYRPNRRYSRSRSRSRSPARRDRRRDSRSPVRRGRSRSRTPPRRRSVSPRRRRSPSPRRRSQSRSPRGRSNSHAHPSRSRSRSHSPRRTRRYTPSPERGAPKMSNGMESMDVPMPHARQEHGEGAEQGELVEFQ